MKPRLIIGNKNYSSWSLRPWLLMKEAGIEFDELCWRILETSVVRVVTEKQAEVAVNGA